MTHWCASSLPAVKNLTFQQDPRWRTATAAVWKIEKSRYVGKGLTDQHGLEVMHTDPNEPDQLLKLQTLTLNQH